MDAPDIEVGSAKKRSLQSPNALTVSDRPGFWQACARGARAGIVFITLATGPLWFLVLSVELAVVAFGLAAGVGLRLERVMLAPIGGYLVTAMWGAILGAIVGPIALLVRLPWGRAGRRTLKQIGDAPIRLLARRQTGAFEGEEEPAPSVSPPRRRRWAKRLGFAALAVIFAGISIGVTGGWIVGRRLRGAIADAKREDPAWTFADLLAARPPLPDEENSAIIVGHIVSRFPEGWPTRPPWPPGTPDPPLGKAQTAFLRLIKTPDELRLDDTTAAILRRELAFSQREVKLARSLAEYERGRHPLDLGRALRRSFEEQEWAAFLVSRLLEADAAVRIHEGDLDGALYSCRAVLSVARSIGSEPLAESARARVAISGLAIKFARRALAQGEPSEISLLEFQADLLDELTQPLLYEAYRGERAITYELLRQIQDAEIPSSVLIEEKMPEAKGRIPHLSFRMQVAFRAQSALSLESGNKLVSIARRDVSEWPVLLGVWEDELEQSSDSFTGRLARVLGAPYVMTGSGISGSILFYKCELGATVIVLAAELHRRKTGRWPTSADEIDRALLPFALSDPFAGQPLRIRQSEGQFVAYSVGPNRKESTGCMTRTAGRRMCRTTTGAGHGTCPCAGSWRP